MLCFSVDSPDSLENITAKWLPEIREHCPDTKLVLVALKCDLRETEGDEEGGNEGQEGQEVKEGLVSYDMGLKVAKDIGASRYLECSAMRNRGVNEAFTEAARVALAVRNVGGESKSKCLVM